MATKHHLLVSSKVDSLLAPRLLHERRCRSFLKRWSAGTDSCSEGSLLDARSAQLPQRAAQSSAGVFRSHCVVWKGGECVYVVIVRAVNLFRLTPQARLKSIFLPIRL